MKNPLVVTEGPYAGLYVPLDDGTAYVKHETRPYAELFDTIIHDSRNDDVFYTSTPHTFIANPVYSVAAQDLQDEYAYYYTGNMPYCNGIVHEVKNRLADFETVTDIKLQRVIKWLRRQPDTPQTDKKLQRPVATESNTESNTESSTHSDYDVMDYDLENFDVDDFLRALE